MSDFLTTLLLLAAVLLGAPYLAIRTHRSLPVPVQDAVNPYTQRPQISEKRILGITKYLSEDIGYRTVGSAEHATADVWMGHQMSDLQKECDRIVRASGHTLQCEFWRQQGSGNHRFDMAGKRLYKTYVDLPNHLFRISNGTAESKENAVLINSHLDSTLPSPGAADDALAVSIMLDCIRVLINSREWSPKHSIIFLFNHAEESLQDGSHLYSTQDPSRSTVRAVINLEAAGTKGRELLFQATSEPMIEAYSHVPRPFGTIFAHEIFGSGILLSDTDFRQFEDYLDVTGLDMAVVGHSYFYHTRKDLVENIETGVAQNMGENTLALLKYLATSPTLPTLKNTTTTASSGIKGDHNRLKPQTVFFSYIGLFWTYSFNVAKALYALLALSSLALVRTRFTVLPRMRSKSKASSEPEQLSLRRGIISIVIGLLGSVIIPNLVAGVMILSGKQMSWYKAPLIGTLSLYCPAAGFGAVLSQYLAPKATEKELLGAVLIMQSFGALIIQMFNIGSAALLFLNAAPIFAVLFVTARTVPGNVSFPLTLAVYAIAGAVPLYNGTLFFIPTLEVFVPLTGRIGASLPSDFLIATITSLCGSVSLPLFLPLVRRFNRQYALLILGSLTVLGVGVAMMRETFGPDHPRRIFVLSLEDMDTKQHTLHIGAQDSAPGMDDMAHAMNLEFAENTTLIRPTSFEEMDVGWNVVYPFSTVLKPYQMNLPATLNAGYSSPWQKRFTLKATKDTISPSGTRILQIDIKHTNVIWTVLSFDAHIIKWTLDDHPPPYKTRHYVREASYHKVDKYRIDLEVAPGPNGHEPIQFEFVGLQEGGLWPSKKEDYLKGKDNGASVSMKLFEKMDTWFEGYSGGTVDATLLGTVKGTVII